jgi:hypothetical protein
VEQRGQRRVDALRHRAISGKHRIGGVEKELPIRPHALDELIGRSLEAHRVGDLRRFQLAAADLGDPQHVNALRRETAHHPRANEELVIAGAVRIRR